VRPSAAAAACKNKLRRADKVPAPPALSDASGKKQKAHRDDLDRQHSLTCDRCRLRQQLTPPQEKLVRVDIIAPGDDRH
jgi:hypothetical protein